MEKELLSEKDLLPAKESRLKNVFSLRLLTSAVIILGLAVALLLRQLTVYLFDVVVLFLLFVTVFEVIKAKNTHQKTLTDLQKAEKKRPASVPVIQGRILKGIYIYIYMIMAYAVFLVGILLATPFTFWTHLIIQAIMAVVFTVYVFMMHYVDEERVRYCRLRNLKLARESWLWTLEYLKVLLYPALLIFMLIPLNHLGNINPVLEDACALDCITEHTHIVSAGTINIGLIALLMVFVISCFTDTAAYLTGRWLKGPKLVPQISPNKTWAGAIGGLFGGVLGALLVMLCFSGNPFFIDFFTNKIGNVWAVRMTVIAFGLLGSIANQIGDIYASWLKRRTRIKDFGNYLPGHGGAMDRLDGISFNTFFVFLCMMVLVFLI